MPDIESAMERLKALATRYTEAANAMARGVTMLVSAGQGEEINTRKLRVSVNTAQADHNALARLLEAKGLIGREEYLEALAIGMESERNMYELEIEKQTGAKVTLG